MAVLVEKFGSYVNRQIASRPAYARRLLLAAYRAYGLKLNYAPKKSLPDSRNYLGRVSMRCMVKPLAHPENQVLTSLFTPCEPFYAMGLVPMCAEQYAAYVNGAGAEHGFIEAAENAGIAETFCSYHKVLAGAVITGVMPKPSAIVNTSLACDANNLTFQKAAELMNVPQYYLDIPYTVKEASVDYVADQMREMVRWLEEITERKLDEQKLREATENSRQTMRILREVIGLRKDRYLPTELTAELYEALMTHNALGMKETLTYAKRLKRDFSASAETPGRKILWMHTNPYYQESVKEIFNAKPDPCIALSEMCFDTLIDTDLDLSDPYRFMAARTVFNSYNGPISRRAERAVEMAEKIDADGVILFCHWGCKETCGASTLIQETLENAGYPVLILNGDGVDRRNSSNGQIQTRIEAFLEMLEGRP